MPYLDNFNVGGGVLKIRDSEAREIIASILGAISGSSGSASKPIFLDNGAFMVCGDTLDVNISGNANSATEANHAIGADNAEMAVEASHASTSDSATNADTATKLSTSAGNSTTPIYFSNGKPVVCGATLDVNISGTASKAGLATTATNADKATALETSAGSSNKPVYFNNGKPVQCGTSLGVDITGNADTSGTRNEVSNSTVHVYTCTNGNIKTMDGYTEAKTYAITNAYGGVYYADVTINLPSYFSGLLCVNVTVQGLQGCYFNVTNFNGSQIKGFLICPISVSVSLSLFLHIVGY